MTFIAAEGLHTGQFVYCGKKAQLTVGNVLPVGSMPEGTIICNIESKTGDRGTLARASGNYGTIISHNPVRRHQKNCTRAATTTTTTGPAQLRSPFIPAPVCDWDWGWALCSNLTLLIWGVLSIHRILARHGSGSRRAARR